MTWIFSVLLSAWPDGNLAEAAEQLAKMVEHPNQSQPNPGPRADGTPCSMWKYLNKNPLKHKSRLRILRGLLQTCQGWRFLAGIAQIDGDGEAVKEENEEVGQWDEGKEGYAYKTHHYELRRIDRLIDGMQHWMHACSLSLSQWIGSKITLWGVHSVVIFCRAFLTCHWANKQLLCSPIGSWLELSKEKKRKHRIWVDAPQCRSVHLTQLCIPQERNRKTTALFMQFVTISCYSCC